MDIQALLESGLLEAYVLGHSSPEETIEILRLSEEHPEIKKEIEQIENTLESFAMAHAVTPPAWMKGRIMDQVNESVKEDKVTEFITEPTASGPMIWALLLMGIILTASMIFFYSQIREKKQQIVQAEQRIADCQEVQQDLQKRADFLRDRQTKPVEMAALPGKDNRFKAVVFYNTAHKASFLDLSGLPSPPTGKDYQLWALVDGKPVSMGVVTVTPDTSFIPITHITDAGAFAVSLEPVGGSPAPTEVVMLGETGE